MNISISVIVPTFRRTDLLQRCLFSLASQSFNKDNYEIIIVSDGEDAVTSALMESWTSRRDLKVYYLVNTAKKGPAASRNLGWKKARGRLIAFTDDDCLPGEDWLKLIWQAYRGEEMIAFTGRVIVPRPEMPTDYENNIGQLETAEFVTANCVTTKKTLELVNGFDERFSMAWREDSDLHFKLLKNNIGIKQIAAPVTHPVRKACWGISVKEQKKGIYNALLYKKYPDLYRQRIKPRPSLNYYAMVFAFLAFAISFAKGEFAIGNIALTAWLIMLMAFVEKRLKTTSKTTSHVMEMLVTSMIIPFASLFWQIYGSVKFRVLFF